MCGSCAAAWALCWVGVVGQKSLSIAEPKAFAEHLGRDLIARRVFRAMNTNIEVTLQDWSRSDLLGRIEQFFRSFENRFSRFLPDSELSELNAGSGRQQPVSPEMLDLLLESRRLHALTGGVFDPAVLTALESAGYDRSFDFVERESAQPTVTQTSRRHVFSDIAIDAKSQTVTLPTDMRLDFGGIGKGYAIDRAAELLNGAGPSLVSAGGDLFGRGDGPYGDGWLIAVTSPQGDEVDRIVLHDEAVATSTVALRSWKRAGRTMHHIINPTTGQPANTGLISVTVVARTASDADVFAKTALILGLEEGRRFLQRQEVQALFVLDHGDVIATDRWPGNAGR